MKKAPIIIFLTIFLCLYSLLNYYIFIRGLKAFGFSGISEIIYITLFAIFYISFPFSRYLERRALEKIAEPFVWTGSLWLAAMFYFFLILVVIDFARLLEYSSGYPGCAGLYSDKAKFLTAAISVVAVFLTVTGGFINARKPHVKKLNLHIGKKAGKLEKLNIVAVSDIHLGLLIKHRMVNRLVGIIKNTEPDIVLLAGDTIDEVLAPVIKYKLGDPLKTINAPLGIYAITGNHEFIGGPGRSVAYLKSLGIKMLNDEVIKIADSFYIAGRFDRDITRFTGRKRAEIKELLKDVETSLPVILLDHQPFALEKSADAGVDLQISGHTHHGQIAPLNFITKAIFNLSRGYKQIRNTHFYVSCGYGTWGPPVRTGNRPEVVQITLEFEKK